MNKKFTTFLASAMLVSAFSVGTVAAYVGTPVAPQATMAAEETPDPNATITPKKGEAVLFQNGSEAKFLGITKGTTFGYITKETGTSQFTLENLNKATWTVSEKKTVLGQTVYSFVNKNTGLTFAVDPSLAAEAVMQEDGETVDAAKTAKKVEEAAVATLGGSATEWVVKDLDGSGKTLVSYVDGNKYVYLATRSSDGKMILVKGSSTSLTGTSVLSIGLNQGNIPQELELGAKDLNTLLQSAVENSFRLNMTPEVTSGKKNHLTATDLVAEDATEGYVLLQAKDQKKDDAQLYVVVDTTYYGGTETDGSLLTYTYDAYGHKNDDGSLKDTKSITGTVEGESVTYTTLKNGRLQGSYKYKFTYNAVDDKLYVQVKDAMHQVPRREDETDAAYAKRIKDSFDNAKWQSAENVVNDKYIYMASLASVNVLSLNTDETEKEKTGVVTQNVKITIGTSFTGLKPTTIPDGVYTVQFKAKAGNPKFAQNGTYALANLAGDFGWADQAKRQDFNHMPAAQWVVKKNGVSTTSAVTIKNREFNDWGADASAESVLPKTSTQFYAVEGSGDVFYFNGTMPDTLTFTKVADELVKDTKLGYKYVTANEAMVQTYTFNYLHGLSLDKYLYTPAGKDSIVRVDENDGKSNFRLILKVKDDKYGYENGLVRNAYYVSDGKGHYISYDSDAKKYMMKSEPTLFFLKENNCDNGKHYYALVKAVERTHAVGEGSFFTSDYLGKEVKEGKIDGKELAKVKDEENTLLYDKDGYRLIKDNSEIKKAYVYTLNEDESKVIFDEIELTSVAEQKHKSTDYATVKVSVDDNTLDLTEGKLNDKFDDGTDNEIRTSAFAVEVDNSPLYRRFDNAELEESETADSLFFVEKIRKEYLMDEWNKNLTDKKVDYAGIWNKEKADGKLAFIVDTAWVNRGAGNIKPQYLVSVARQDQAGTPGVPCTYAHNHFDNAGNPVEADKCSHATPASQGFNYGKYLVSFGDSALIKGKEYKTPYMDIDGGYTRVGFVKAIHAGDSLFILVNDFANMKPEELNVETIIKAYEKAKINETYIVNLRGDNHKNVTWSFRYVNPDKAAQAYEDGKEGENNEFMFESNIYSETADAAVTGNKGKATAGYKEVKAGSIAPQYAAWLKMQNGCLVLTRGDSEFSAAKTGSDGALIFNAYQKTDAEDMVTSIEGANAEGVSIVAGNGTVTVQGAAGKSIVITNILGKVVAETVLTSDNATIAVPAGIVAVAVDGEEAVKAIVK